SSGVLAIRDLPLHAFHQHHQFFGLVVSLCLLAHLLEILRGVAHTIGHGGCLCSRRRHSFPSPPTLAKPHIAIPRWSRQYTSVPLAVMRRTSVPHRLQNIHPPLTPLSDTRDHSSQFPQKHPPPHPPLPSRGT